MYKTLGELAREQADITLAQAAKRLRRGARYLRGFELHGGAPMHIAERLGVLYGCPDTYFEQPVWVEVDPRTRQPYETVNNNSGFRTHAEKTK